jgi:hypothetical protein
MAGKTRAWRGGRVDAAHLCSLLTTTTKGITDVLHFQHIIHSTSMHTSEYDYLFKLLLIGDSGVGKVNKMSCENSMDMLTLKPQTLCF